MNDFFRESLFAGVTLSLLSYFIGSVLKKKFKLGIFNPLLISIIITIIVLAVSGVDYDVYNQGARYLSWFLTPATVCLAIPLYEHACLDRYPDAVTAVAFVVRAQIPRRVCRRSLGAGLGTCARS